MKMTVASFIVAGLALGCGRDSSVRKAAGDFTGVKGFENVEGRAKLEEAPLPGAAKHHPGDLGNIKIKDDGKGYLELTTEGGNLKPNDPMSFANRAIIIHQGEDQGTPPSGNAGKPLACAVIKST